jgi:hypothetical protein
MLRDRKSARVAARALHAWYATQTREYAERQLAAATQIAAVALESTAGDKQRRARVLDRDVTRCVNRRTTRALAAYFRPWAVFTAVRVSTRLAYVSETTTNDAGRRTPTRVERVCRVGDDAAGRPLTASLKRSSRGRYAGRLR